MRMAIINASEEHSQYVGHVYQQHYARLRHYFLAQFSDVSEADACVQETINRFFFFMEERCWEADAEYIPVYLMRIAGFLCSKKLAERSSLHRNRPGWRAVAGLLDKLGREVIQPIKARIEFTRLLLKAWGDGRPHHLSSVPR